MDDALVLQALREEMVFLRVLLAGQYANSIEAGAATRDEMAGHIAHSPSLRSSCRDIERQRSPIRRKP